MPGYIIFLISLGKISGYLQLFRSKHGRLHPTQQRKLFSSSTVAYVTAPPIGRRSQLSAALCRSNSKNISSLAKRLAKANQIFSEILGSKELLGVFRLVVCSKLDILQILTPQKNAALDEM